MPKFMDTPNFPLSSYCSFKGSVMLIDSADFKTANSETPEAMISICDVCLDLSIGKQRVFIRLYGNFRKLNYEFICKQLLKMHIILLFNVYFLPFLCLRKVNLFCFLFICCCLNSLLPLALSMTSFQNQTFV